MNGHGQDIVNQTLESVFDNPATLEMITSFNNFFLLIIGIVAIVIIASCICKLFFKRLSKKV